MNPELNPNLNLYDADSICCLCECAEGNHLLFNSCPILDNNPICHDCCVISCLKNDIAEKFSKVVGKDITLDEVNKICQDCGLNYGKQNEELAKKLEQESL